MHVGDVGFGLRMKPPEGLQFIHLPDSLDIFKQNVFLPEICQRFFSAFSEFRIFVIVQSH